MKYLWLYIIVFIASLGGLLSGYDTGVISGALLFINDAWNLSDSLQGLLVSSVLIGAVIGAAINGFLADVYGRKKVIMAVALVFIIGSLMSAFAPNIIILIASRIFVGLAVGVVNFVVPLYISEISPKHLRGTLVSLYQWAITFGILFAYFINVSFSKSVYNWRWMLFAGVLPGLILFIGMCFMQDSPRWLISKGREDEAKKVFLKIDADSDVDKEISEVQKTLVSSKEQNKFVFKKWMLMPFVVGVGIMFVQVFTGINTVIYYAPTIFKTSGFDSNITAIYATAGIGVVNFLTTIVAIYFTDRLGRKPLLYIGLAGLFISLTLLGCTFEFENILGDATKWFSVGCVVAYVISFAMSLGPIGFIIMSEVFPLSIRGFSMSICILANFAFNFIVVSGFPIMLHRMGGAWTFWSFAFITVFCMIFVYFFIPETKGISLEKIEENWLNGVKPRNF